ncbi:BRO family protein, partial [Bilophila wadsworthia]
MSNLPIFSHPSFGTVRIVERNDEPWFVAKDVLKALGYAEDYNPSRALQAVPEEWKGVQPIHTPGGMQEMLIISEQGLYFFLGRSDKPVALPFQKWLAGDVIPSIRKHGLYATEEVVDRILDDPDFGITLLQRYKFEREQRQLAESQRDEAIRTKAWISDKKTASAMATASVAVRKAAALENELGRGRDYKAVKGIPWFLEVFSNTPAAYSVAGRKLSELSRRMGYEILEVEDSRFGSVKAYHIDVIESFRLALRNDLNMLGKYR